MFYDLAVRDVEIAIAAYTLARLTEARDRPTVEGDPGQPAMPGASAEYVRADESGESRHHHGRANSFHVNGEAAGIRLAEG